MDMFLDIGPLYQASRKTHRSCSLSAASPKISRSALGKIQPLLSAVENNLSRQSKGASGRWPWSFKIPKGSKDFGRSSNSQSSAKGDHVGGYSLCYEQFLISHVPTNLYLLVFEVVASRLYMLKVWW